MNKIIGHFKTITTHKLVVMKECFKIGLYKQGLLHDMSKFSPVEFFESVKYYQGGSSPIDAAKKANGYSKAWLHHKGHNRHHYEYWTDYNIVTKQLEGVEMPAKYFVEMVCDRIAASKIYAGDNYTDRAPLDYFRRGRGHMLINDRTCAELEKVLKMLAVCGEDKVFAYLRRKVWSAK